MQNSSSFTPLNNDLYHDHHSHQLNSNNSSKQIQSAIGSPNPHLSIKNERPSSSININNTTPSSTSTTTTTTSASASTGLRKKQSQRFTVTHNHSTTPSEPIPLLPLGFNNHHHQDFTTSSLSSTSDSDHHPSHSGYPSNPQSSSTTSNFDSASIFGPFSDSSTSISRNGTSLSPAGSIAPPNPIGSMSAMNINTASASPSAVTPDAEDEIIPTAIVIKNIPFSVRREQLLTIIEDLMIPLPYAFNYHFDNGVFRGLAFANFRSSAEADAAVAGLNGFDISGRKLRVEYKKVLQAGEKERIEKEKAIKRMRSMQLQKESSLAEQYASSQQQPPPLPMSSSSTHITFGNYSNLEDDYRGLGIHNTNQHIVPSSIPHRPSQSALNSAHSSNFLHQQYLASGHELGMAAQQAFEGLSLSDSKQSSSKELDMNDPQTLELYSRIVVFKEDNLRDELAFAKSLSGPQRRIVHQIAKKLGLEHRSEGLGDDRFVVVAKPSPSSLSAMPRINRVASSANMARVASSQQAGHYLGQQPTRLFDGHNNLTTANLLRMKKSMPDMRMREMNHSGVFYPDSTATASMKDLLGARKSNMNLRELNSAASQSKSLVPFSFNNNNHHHGSVGEELSPTASSVALFSNHHSHQNPLLGNNNNNNNTNNNNGNSSNSSSNNPHQIIRQPKGPEGGSGKGFGISNNHHHTLNPTQQPQHPAQRGLQRNPSRGTMNSHHHHPHPNDDADEPSSSSPSPRHHLAIGGHSSNTSSTDPPLEFGTLHHHHHQA